MKPCTVFLLCLATGVSAAQGFVSEGKATTGWRPHVVRQTNGTDALVEIPAQFQIVTEAWNRVVAVPYMVYMPEKSRALMLVGCDYPHHAMVLTSDDLGATWTEPRPLRLDGEGKFIPGLGTSLTCLTAGVNSCSSRTGCGSARIMASLGAGRTARRSRLRLHQRPTGNRGTNGTPSWC